MSVKAVFLDKDGTLIPDIPYNADPALITIEKDALSGLKLLYDAGYVLIIISNQSGIARGYFTEDKMPAIELKINKLLASEHIALTGFYYCPHHPKGIIDGYNIDCACRKPKPGMILNAAKDHKINLSASWMIGDILNDVEAGNLAGCQSILINNGNETEWLMGKYRVPAFTCNTINKAAAFILSSL